MKKPVWILILVNIALLLINIGQPLLEGSATRQIYSAMVAKHFYQENMNILYPRIPIKGDEPFYQALEMQITPYLAAVFYKVSGGVHTEIFRIIAIIFTVLALWALYKLMLQFADERSALVACFIFSFSPINIFLGRSANFEMPIIFFNIMLLYCFYMWTKTERLRYCIMAALAFFFAITLKLTNLYLMIPLAYMAFSKWRWKALRINPFILAAFVAAAVWQGWLAHLRAVAPDKNWLHFSLSYNLGSIAECFTSGEFYKKVYSDALNYVLTPPVLVLALLGAVLKPASRKERVFYFWFAGVLFFYAIMPEGLGAHGYYHVHYLPIACFFAAKAFWLIVDRLGGYVRFRTRASFIFFFAAIFIILGARYALPFYTVPQNKKYVLKTAEYVRQWTKPQDLIVACVDSPSSLLYYSDRKGWGVEFSYRGEEAMNILEEQRSRGAAYFVCAFKQELNDNPGFLRYLTTRYKVIFENDFCLIVDLR